VSRSLPLRVEAVLLTLSLLCSACHGAARRDAASAPTRLAGDECPSKPALMTPAEFEACAPDLMQRPHIDYADVVAFTDVTYSVIYGFRPLKMTIYMPKGGRAPLPLVVFVHGGGWRLDPEGSEGASGIAAVLQLARRGYVVAVPAYRTSGEAAFPAQLQDVKAAIRYAKTHAVIYGADAARVAVWGASAGGNLAALVATTCGLAQFEPAAHPTRTPGGPRIPFIDPGADACVRTAVDWFGPIDFSTLDAQAAADGQTAGVHGLAGSPESLYIGCAVADCASERVQAPNPIQYAGPHSAPTLIMHGQEDRRVPWQQSRQLYDALRARGVDTQLLLVPGADHEFAGLSDQQRREQVDRVIEWLGSHTAS
jgi:acetyl esterase/lipase